MNGNESWVPATAVRLHLYHIINNFAVHPDIATTQTGRTLFSQHQNVPRSTSVLGILPAVDLQPKHGVNAFR